MTQKYNFGEIWLANLNPKAGTEAGKTRTVLILQSQILLNIPHPSTIILPLTTKLIRDAEPLRIRLKAQGKLEKDLDIMIDQIRSIDNKRLIEGPLLKCNNKILFKVKDALTEVLDLNNIFNEDV